MLANSNLSLVTPTSTANVSASNGDATASAESFDAVYQEANNSLSASSSVALSPENVEGSTAVATEEESFGVLVTEAEQVESPTASSGSTSEETPLVDSEGSVIADGTIAKSVSSGISPSISVDASTDTSIVKGTNLAENKPTINLDTHDASLAGEEVVGIAGASALALGAKELKQVVSSEKAAKETDLVASQASIKGDKEGLNLSGKPLQTQGAEIAMPVTTGEEGVDSDLLVKGGAALAAGSVINQPDGTTIAAHSPTSEGDIPQTSFSQNVETPLSDLKDLDAAETSLGITASTAVLSGNKTSGELTQGDAEQVAASSVKSDVTGAAELTPQSLVAKSTPESLGNVTQNDGVDIAAGLAMIGAGSLAAKSAKDSTNQAQVMVNGVDASLVGKGADDVVGNNADLDWIMQQMGGDTAQMKDASIITETLKPQSSSANISQVAPQTTDQMLKQAAPLSLGLAATESGLVEPSGELDNVVKVNENGTLVTKTEVDAVKQLESAGMGRGGLGESLSLTTSTSSSAVASTQPGLNDVKLGVAANLNNNQMSMTMQVPPSHPNWSSEMGEKMMWMNKQGLQQAEIHLDPPELGSLTVKVSVDADVASVSFVAASTQVKDLLEGQVQRLREMLAQQGVELAEVDVNVSQQGSGSQQSNEDANSQFAHESLDADQEELDSGLMANEARVSRSKVDFYA